MRINCGYIICYSYRIDENTEVVMGCNAEGTWVTWACNNGNYYYWGNYFETEVLALRNLLARIDKEA